jgi:hypothetical protein
VIFLRVRYCIAVPAMIRQFISIVVMNAMILSQQERPVPFRDVVMPSPSEPITGDVSVATSMSLDAIEAYP